MVEIQTIWMIFNKFDACDDFVSLPLRVTIRNTLKEITL